MVTDPDDDHADYVLRLILARCPELGPADLALMGGAAPDPDAIPASVCDKIVDVLLALEDRMLALEQARAA